MILSTFNVGNLVLQVPLEINSALSTTTVGKLKGSKICPRWVLVKEQNGVGGELAPHPMPFLPQASHLVKGSRAPSKGHGEAVKTDTVGAQH